MCDGRIIKVSLSGKMILILVLGSLWAMLFFSVIFINLFKHKQHQDMIMNVGLYQSTYTITLFVMPRTVAHQAPLSLEFSRQEYWSELHFILQRIFPTQVSNPGLLHCRQTLYHLSHQGSPIPSHGTIYIYIYHVIFFIN